MTGVLLVLGTVAVVCAVDVFVHWRRVRRALRGPVGPVGRERLP